MRALLRGILLTRLRWGLEQTYWFVKLDGVYEAGQGQVFQVEVVSEFLQVGSDLKEAIVGGRLAEVCQLVDVLYGPRACPVLGHEGFVQHAHLYQKVRGDVIGCRTVKILFDVLPSRSYLPPV